MSARILILFAQPSLHRSEVDRPLLEANRQAETNPADGADGFNDCLEQSAGESR